ncbi:ABCA3.2 family protein [Megaselia abdita]
MATLLRTVREIKYHSDYWVNEPPIIIEEMINDLELENYLARSDIFAGIEFPPEYDLITECPTHFQFSIRFPSTSRKSYENKSATWNTNQLYNIPDSYWPRGYYDGDGGSNPGYFSEGFVYLQEALSLSYIKLCSKNPVLIPKIQYQQMPTLVNDDVMGCKLLNFVYPMLMMGYIVCVIYIAKTVTLEKEKQLKEIQKIMGVSTSVQWMAWILTFFVLLLCISLLVIVIYKTPFGQSYPALLPKTSFSVLLILFIGFQLSTITFTFIFCVIFSKATNASVMAAVLFIFTVETVPDLNCCEKWFLTLKAIMFPNYAFGYAFDIIKIQEFQGFGAQWWNADSPPVAGYPFNLASIIAILYLEEIMYVIIFLYIEQAFPGKNCVRQPFYFPFSSSYWCRKQEPEIFSVYNREGNKTYQEESRIFRDQPAGISLINVKKAFNRKCVIENLTLEIAYGEITVLLGHNGAGKTTIMSLITGMVKPNYGRIVVNGYDVVKNLNRARYSMGYCPQQNILFDNLTVAEHMFFFGHLKGLTKREIDVETFKFMEILHLQSHAKVKAKNLSEGMKRKLSVIAAFCGDSRIVLCDEPSSGLDPAARRDIWKILLSEKNDRTIFITTHDMDEAEALGDKIAIINEGELKVEGTSYALKKKLADGYTLTLQVKDGQTCNSKEITQFLQYFIPEVVKKTEIPTELSFKVLTDNTFVLAKMLNELEKNLKRFRLSSYGVSIATMEEVFMAASGQNSNDVVVDVNFMNCSTYKQCSGFSLFLSKVKAMFYKKCLYLIKNPLVIIIQLSLVFTCALLMRDRESPLIPLGALNLTLDTYDQKTILLEEKTSGPWIYLPIYYRKLVAETSTKTDLIEFNNRYMNEFVVEKVHENRAFVKLHYMAGATIKNDLLTVWYNTEFLHAIPISVNTLMNALVLYFMGNDHSITVINKPLPFASKEHSDKNGRVTDQRSEIAIFFSIIVSFFLILPIRERVTGTKMMQHISGVRICMYWMVHFIWDLALCVLFIHIAVLTLHVCGSPAYQSSESVNAFILLMFCFCLSSLALVYLLSIVSQESSLGISYFVLLHIGAVLLYKTVSASSIISSGSSWNFHIYNFLCFIPPFALASALGKISQIDLERNLCFKLCQKIDCSDCLVKSYTSWTDGILAELIWLTLEFLLMFGFLLLVDAKLLHCTCNRQICYYENKDEDINKEKTFITNTRLENYPNPNLVVRNLSKSYGACNKVQAVRGLSFQTIGFNCFGILGVNGAGKSTALKLLTGELKPQCGEIFVNSLNSSKHFSLIRQKIGYCPQINALFQAFTIYENIKFICLCRGIHGKDTKQIIENYAKAFEFEQHLSMRLGRCSNGTQRKISATIAFINCPSVVFLDEPTAGMDPKSKRQIWNVVLAARNRGIIIVLSSHSMEECEVLCTRLAIMVGGEFKCIGTSQHLKNKFSTGFILRMKMTGTNISFATAYSHSTITNKAVSKDSFGGQYDFETVTDSLFSEFPKCTLREKYERYLIFHIPKDTRTTYSSVFSFIEDNKVILGIEDYTISQASLEEIFMKFALDR